MTETTRCVCGRVHSVKRGGSLVCPCRAVIMFNYARRQWEVTGPNGPMVVPDLDTVHMPIGATQDVPPGRPKA